MQTGRLDVEGNVYVVVQVPAILGACGNLRRTRLILYGFNLS